MVDTHGVGVPIDTSEPLQFNSELVRLVEAVVKADAHDEHDWIEWKRRLDLSTKNAQERIAKHVLGFANRTVQAAAMHTGGYGYILVGVEPGSVTGVDTIDPATLTNAILRYIGADGPRYNFEYVPFGGYHVLVVAVRPPQHGDPVHTLRHQLAQHRPGRVLVRRIGETEEAAPSELSALVERAKANSNTIIVALRALGGTIAANSSDLRAQADAALAAERELLMRPNRATRPAPKPHDQTAARLARLSPKSYNHPGFGPTFEEDERTEDDYAAEVEKYLEALRPELVKRAANRRWREPSGMLHLALDNLTARNFAQVRLWVHVAGIVREWPEDLTDKIRFEDDLPTRPRPLGERKRIPSPYDRTIWPQPSYVPRFDGGSLRSPGFMTRDGGSVDIEFDPVHLHPHLSADLPPVPLLVDEPAGAELRITWKATSESADGLADGATTVMVVEPPLAQDLLRAMLETCG